jgi:hypothetical protein
MWGFHANLSRKEQIWLKWVKNIGQFTKKLSIFYCRRRHKFATNHPSVTPNISILLPTTSSSTPQTERLVTFPLQKWLRERGTILRYTYIAYASLYILLFLLLTVLPAISEAPVLYRKLCWPFLLPTQQLFTHAGMYLRVHKEKSTDAAQRAFYAAGRSCVEE